jgi:hypothetical protein
MMILEIIVTLSADRSLLQVVLIFPFGGSSNNNVFVISYRYFLEKILI